MKAHSSFVVAATLCVTACSKPATTVYGTATPARPPASVTAAPAAPAAPTGAPVTIRTATATVRDAAGATVGRLTFTEGFTGVLVTGSLSGLGLGEHGIHIHEVGKCEPPFATAGGHFNPQGRKHGFASPVGAHLGDMSNFASPAAGAAPFSFLLPGVTLTGANRLLDADGSAVVVHAAKDDYMTDPSGNSGGRIACGVITAS